MASSALAPRYFLIRPHLVKDSVNVSEATMAFAVERAHLPTTRLLCLVPGAVGKAGRLMGLSCLTGTKKELMPASCVHMSDTRCSRSRCLHLASNLAPAIVAAEAWHSSVHGSCHTSGWLSSSSPVTTWRSVNRSIAHWLADAGFREKFAALGGGYWCLGGCGGGSSNGSGSHAIWSGRCWSDDRVGWAV